jgi:signal transduction histidine kinase
MIHELLDITAIESGNMSLNPESGDLIELLNGCIEFHRRHAERKDIGVYMDKDVLLPAVIMDRMRIAEVMDNLLSNSIKYTMPGGSIHIRFTQAENFVWMHVKDTGQGLDDNDQKNIFHGFKKLSSRPTGGETSTGLGLMIVKKIIEKHGGTIRVASKKGEGSIFSFSLPIYLDIKSLNKL